MSFLDGIKKELAERARKKKEDQETLHQLRLQAEAERQRVFAEQFKKDSFEVAIAKAKKEAAEKSGLQKLRATNRLRNLQKQEGQPGNAFERLREYTQRNLAKREENLERTAEMRGIAGVKQERKGVNSPTYRKPFGSPGFK